MAQLRDLSDEQICEALRKSGGIVQQAGFELGVRRASLSKRVNKSPVLMKAREDALEEFKDVAESMLFTKIREGDKIAIIFFLKCMAKDRGYVERSELTGKDGTDLGQVVAPVRALSPEQWLKQNEAA